MRHYPSFYVSSTCAGLAARNGSLDTAIGSRSARVDGVRGNAPLEIKPVAESDGSVRHAELRSSVARAAARLDGSVSEKERTTVDAMLSDGVTAPLARPLLACTGVAWQHEMHALLKAVPLEVRGHTSASKSKGASDTEDKETGESGSRCASVIRDGPRVEGGNGAARVGFGKL